MNRRLLVLVFFLALVLRFWNLGNYPDAIDEDEMALGYYGYSLVQNGTDEFGNKFPIYFESVGDYKYGLYSYFAAIPISVFGLNPVTTRSVAALAGSFSVIAIYLLAKEILKREKYALASAFVLAVSPAHIHFSRVAYNNILGALFAILSVVYFLRFIKKDSNKTIIAFFVLFVLSIYSYQAYRVFLPATFLLIGAISIGKFKKKAKLLGVLLASILIVVASFIPANSRARSQSLSDLVVTPKIIEDITEDAYSETPIIVTRAFHNKVFSFGQGVIKRYIRYFDPTFLFVQSSAGSSRHSIPDFGLQHLIEIPLFMFGALALFVLVKTNKKYIPLAILFTSPLAASLVQGEPSTTRAVIMTYAFSLIIGLGIYYLVSLKSNGKYLAILLGVIYLSSLCFFSHQYYVHKKYHHPWYGDVGLKEMVEEVNSRQEKYSAVVVSGGHYIPFLFYNTIDPLDFIRNSTFVDKALAGGAKVINFKNIYFNMPYDCPSAGKRGVLYVCFGYQVPQKANLVQVIRFRDGQPAILLVEFIKGANEQNLPEKVKHSENSDSRFPSGFLPNDYEAFWPVQ